MKKLIFISLLLTVFNSLANPAKPHIIIKDASSKEIEYKNGIGPGQMGSMWLEVVSDNDDVYKITNVNCILVRGTSQVANLRFYNGKVDLSLWAATASHGDRIVITVTRVVKIVNGKTEETVDVNGLTINIPLN